MMFVRSIFVGLLIVAVQGASDSSPKTSDSGSKSVPPEDDPANFKDQNATKLLELEGKHWVIKSSVELSDLLKGQPDQTATVTNSGIVEVTRYCAYAEKKGNTSETNYTMEIGYKEGEKWQKNETALFLRITGSHTDPNSLYFQAPDEDSPQDHRLIYTNYNNCTVVRMWSDFFGSCCFLTMLDGTFGGSSTPKIPEDCNSKFNADCNGTVYDIYNSSCIPSETLTISDKSETPS